MRLQPDTSSQTLRLADHSGHPGLQRANPLADEALPPPLGAPHPSSGGTLESAFYATHSMRRTKLPRCALGVKVSLFKPERSLVPVGPRRHADQSPRPPLSFG
jgi:hypothetical protein